MTAFAVIEYLDVIEGVSRRFGARGVMRTMRPLILETIEPALRRRGPRASDHRWAVQG